MSTVQSEDAPVRVRRIEDPDGKEAAARTVLEALTDWFGVEESREKYIRESRDQIFFAAERDGRVEGFLCLKRTGDATAELAVMGVLPDRHRRGTGAALFAAARDCAAAAGYAFLQVKTVRMGCYEDYDHTNRFYRRMGFRELEVIPELWGPENPCQIYVMSLAEPAPAAAEDGPGAQVRAVTAGDRDFWLSLDRHLPAGAFDRKVRDGMGWVATLDGKPAGILRGSLFWDSIPFCDLLYITEEHRGRGLGRLLMTRWEQAMKDRGFDLAMTSTQSDESAQGFYRKLGYRDCGVLTLPFPGHEQPAELILAKTI